MSRQGQPQTFRVDFIRWTLSYDEILGEPALTVIGNILPKSRLTLFLSHPL